MLRAVNRQLQQAAQFLSAVPPPQVPAGQGAAPRVALAQIARGSGAVFQVAGGCGLGALDAAKEKHVWGIGVDYDQSALGPHMLTSVLKRMDIAAYEAIRTLVDGTFRAGGTTVYDLANGGVGLGKISARVPPSFLGRVERIRRAIIAGKIGPIPTKVR